MSDFSHRTVVEMLQIRESESESEWEFDIFFRATCLELK